MTGAEQYYVVDAEDRIVHVAGGRRAPLSRFLGHSLWECSPGARSLFGPSFDEARRTGREVEFTTFYAGTVARRRVVPAGDALAVYVTPLQELDVSTLATLAESLGRIEAALDARAHEQRDPPARAFPQALP